MNIKKSFVQLRSLAADIAAKKGPLVFFALFQQDGASSEWDVVVSAPWLNASGRESYLFIAHQVHGALSKADWQNISRVVILEDGGAEVRALVDRFKENVGFSEMPFTMTSGAVIGRSLVVVAQLPKRPTRPRAERIVKPIQTNEKVSFGVGETSTARPHVVTTNTSPSGLGPLPVGKSGIVQVIDARKETEGGPTDHLTFPSSPGVPTLHSEVRSSTASQ